MTGMSLGSRLSGSFGSLPQLAQNGGNHNVRRSLKTSLNGSRERERSCLSAFRYLPRKKVGMLILAVLAFFAFMTGFFTINKEDDFKSSWLVFDARYLNNSYVANSLLPARKAMLSNINPKINEVIVCNGSSRWEYLFNSMPMDDSSNEPTDYTDPCADFAFPPPPPGDMRRAGPRPCPVCYIPVEQAIARMPRVPSPSPVLHHLNYLSEENPLKVEPNGGSNFGGYPSLKQRNDSFNIKESMTVHCGFIKGCRAGYQTGFDIDVADLEVLEQFHEVIVTSAVFGNYDVIQQPMNIGETARSKVPFFMFVDEETESYIKNYSLLSNDKHVGLWRIIVVHNVPYTDSRRNGKVPKLLLHRLFSNTRFSIWIDGKLQLVVDPYQILERFLWRKNATFAISRHYRRFDVFEEAEANKAGGKYDNISIDYQVEFYRKEGLTPYTIAKLPITSDVPEGCVIIREHIPITNLFSCLWFNEVDRFTSRDQLSFSTVRDKISAQLNWSVNMFLDCERRNFVIQAYHRDLLEQRAQMSRLRRHPPPALAHDKPSPRRVIVRRGRDKRRKRHRATPRKGGSFFS
ncbi:probable hexosyltransferase MUCI70 [Andrographis paniculata]|uniref:probable hexosyltransferase MUCI70 n=1 Tax=Andrographis paniculata TaxID=175694 RepID=UPI0021E79E94|nr:probable hexosyltransferase MUCI70 [Andrographis paniculata]